jgi:2-polyprenyl-3-methyl-5-hydroxy-6-metoxy-1,4-benzoquinol methylase
MTQPRVWGSTPSPVAIRMADTDPPQPQEVYGRAAIRQVARALPPFERMYAHARFSILRPKLLSVLDLLLPAEGDVLDVGCGFGLFAAYFGQTQPARHIVGVDPDARRIGLARQVARTLGLSHEFHVGTTNTVALQGPFAACYVLDVLHHIPREAQFDVLVSLRDLLERGGTLVIKDITTEPRYALSFTKALDRLMVGWREPLAYRHHADWGMMLKRLGFSVRIVRVPDVLPYPHVVIAAKRS